jgi:hypothetical protein
MRVPLWASELARAFWDAAGGPEPFPRTLHGAILRSPFELTVKELRGLRLAAVGGYLSGLGIVWPCGEPDRPLRACLAAAGGAGFILLDGDDPPPERVFSLAHEVAHFLRHYRQPRTAACRRLGEPIAEVIDARRAATPAERVRALLADTPLGLHVHLMERGSRGEVRSRPVAQAEEEADHLAYELLAPASAVAARTAHLGETDQRPMVVQVLQEVFGLPAARAADYANVLVPPADEDPLLLRLRTFSPRPRGGEGQG